MKLKHLNNQMVNVPFFMRNAITRDKASTFAKIMKIWIFLMTLRVSLYQRKPKLHSLT
jgi:hypothetical protein